MLCRLNFYPFGPDHDASTMTEARALLAQAIARIDELSDIDRQRVSYLEQRSTELAHLQVGVLVAMIKTQSLRDRMTARHAAAVARYSRELARVAGCTAEEQELVHTAGLLRNDSTNAPLNPAATTASTRRTRSR